MFGSGTHAATCLTLLAMSTLVACSGPHLSLGPGAASLRVVDGEGNELTGGGRLETVPDGYAIYACDPAAAGFILEYGPDFHVATVSRGRFFSGEDLCLVATDLPGRVDIGGYQVGSSNMPFMGSEMFVARVVLGRGGNGRTVRTALPTGPDCIAEGFSYTAHADGSASFSWTYRNTGDYSQDGEVNISDLTPLGINLNTNSSAGNWASASLADGDGNGEVNQSDITPIGQHYLTALNGYKLERAASEAGPFTEAASLVLNEGTKVPRLSFAHDDAGAVDGAWYRVRAFSSADPTLGASTEAIRISLQTAGTAPQPNFTYTPNPAFHGDTLQFVDTSTGKPTGWQWTFGDGGTSSLQSPTHNYAAAGQYSVSLTASNAFGSRKHTKQVVISTVEPGPGPETTFVAEASATLNTAGTAFTINSTDLPDGADILYGPLTQGMPPVDNHLVLTYPNRGGLNEPAAVHQDISTLPGVIGITVAGMVIYGASNASTITVSGTTWTYNANAAMINGEDVFGGHASPVNGGQYHYHDVAFIANNSWVGVEDFDGVYVRADGHSKLVGWAMDGYPIYGPYGYIDPLNSGSGVELMTSSWQASNTGANRPPAVNTTAASSSNNSKFIVLPSDPGALGANPGMRLTAVNGVAPAEEVWIMNQQNITYVGGGHPPYMGPANGVEMNLAVTIPNGATLKFEFLAGCFIEDNAYVGGGTLDRYNGRYCVTPDYPGGTYAYFCTMDAMGMGIYPYMIGPELYGSSTVGGTPGGGYVRPSS